MLALLSTAAAAQWLASVLQDASSAFSTGTSYQPSRTILNGSRSLIVSSLYFQFVAPAHKFRAPGELYNKNGQVNQAPVIPEERNRE